MLAAVLPTPRGVRLIAGVCLLLTLATAAAEDDVVTAPNAEAEAGDEQPGAAKPADAVFGKTGALAKHLRLGWAGKRLVLDTEQMPNLSAFVAKHEKRITAGAAKQAVEAAVKEGLSRQRAEQIFGDLARGRGIVPPADAENAELALMQRQQVRAFRPRQLQQADGGLAAEDVDDDGDADPLSPIQRAFHAAHQAAFATGGGGGSSSGGNGAMQHESFETPGCEGSLRFNPAREDLSLEGSGRKLAITRDGDTVLTIRLETEAGEGDGPDELLRIRQTDTAFRAILVRDGATVGSAEGEHFAAACTAAPAFVREHLVPLLESIGICAPPLPEDPAVKAAVLAEIRAAAGGPAVAAEEKHEPDAKDASPAERAAAAEWRQALRAYRAKRFASLIEAFRLAEDADYLRGLLDGATAEDAAVVRARLEKLGKAK